MAETISELDQLLNKLTALGRLETAWRPAEALGDANLQADVTALLGSYPFLQRDDGYVAFLRRYGGGLVIRDEDGLLLSLFGFSHDIGMHLVEGPGEPIHDGCLIFSDMVVPRVPGIPDDTVAMGFGFEAAGERRWGVYRFLDGGERAWYCETFLEWLGDVVEKEGRLLY